MKYNQRASARNISTVLALISMTQNWFDVTENTNIGRDGFHGRKAFDLEVHIILDLTMPEPFRA